MQKYFLLFAVGICLSALPSFASESLVKFHSADEKVAQEFARRHGGSLELVSQEGNLYKWTHAGNFRNVRDAAVAFIEPNRRISIPANPSLEANKAAMQKLVLSGAMNLSRAAFADNPAIKLPGAQQTGADPMISNAWGLAKIGAIPAFSRLPQGKDIIVAVTDTGVDYNHTDLIQNMWRNAGEIADDGIDNDGNGFVDDMVGWDFASKDNKPYDLSMSPFEILFSGGNPGHGTHCAGVIAARLNNASGAAGTAPKAKLMALRFITEKGQGTTADAISAVDYAVKNGAHIISASWGGERGDDAEERGLEESIQRAMAKGVIFVAAAGNGRSNGTTAPAGFDNDTDAKPMVPASYDIANVIAVSAMDINDQLASFSNWGRRSVDIGAPGVKILSTVPGNRYQDTVIDMGGMKVTWDGTSMATPFVAGALAVIWSTKPTETWQQVYASLLSHTVSVPALSGKVSTQGRLDLTSLR